MMKKEAELLLDCVGLGNGFDVGGEQRLINTLIHVKSLQLVAFH